MTRYRYKAFAKEGALQKGTLEAASARVLKSHLRTLGLSLVSYSLDLSHLFSRKIKPQVLMDLCLHLEQFENAGIPLKDSLEELHLACSTPKLQTILMNIIKDIEGGLLFSLALAKYPSVFDSVFVGLITVGEKTGNLAFAFHHLFQHLKWVDEVQAQTFKALRYPLIMATVLLTVVLILMTVLVPELVKFIQNSKAEIPLTTLLLLSFSGFCSDHFFPMMTTAGIISALGAAFFKYHSKGPLWTDRLLGKFPLIGPLRKMIFLARFCHVFAVLFESGIDIIQALQIARKSLKPGQIHTALETVEVLVKEGLSLSDALQKVGAFPSLVVRMVKVGEQTSALQKTLSHVKEYFDTTLKRRVDHMMGLIEPCMILSVGLVMTWVIYSIFLPLYDTLSIVDY
ncbi:MAG TPA: type II secretion system F family protein [Alphaproteobacteria bacterium]|nr:type II secretion system F family protein [Alphaproteobacteria bacterium]